MSNKFPGFVEITPEHARSIQFDVPLYFAYPNSQFPEESLSPEDRRDVSEWNPGWESNYWKDASAGARYKWYIKTDGDKPEYSPTTTTDTQHQ